MFGFLKKKQEPSFDSLIGRSVQIYEDRIDFEHGLHIDGTINTNLVATTELGLVRVSIHGEVNGNITSPNVLIAGTVNGDIVASDSVEIALDGRVNGRVICNNFKGDATRVLNGVGQK